MNYTIILQNENGGEITRKYNEMFFLDGDKEHLAKALYDMFYQLSVKGKEVKF